MPEENINNLDKQFISGSLAYTSYAGPVRPYSGSLYQAETYKKITTEDASYKNFIIKKYGSYENYLRTTNLLSRSSVFDPTRDFKMDVTVITSDVTYKSDHISADEIILESMSGICSFSYIKKDGSPGRTNGTLEKNFIPTTQLRYRSSFFSPLPKAKIGVWDIYKQEWNIIFLRNMLKFVKDDTSGLE